MELEELKALWNQSNRKLEASTRLNRLLLTQWNLRKTDTSLKRLVRGIAFELIVTLACVFLLGWFAAGHAGEPKFFIPVAMLDIYAIALVIAGARQFCALRSPDYNEPIVAIQSRLQRLRLARIRATMWTLLFAPLMWLPLLIVASRGLFGIDIYAAVSPAWLAANATLGLVVIPVAIALAKAYGSKLERDTPMRLLAALRRFAEEG